MEAIATTGLTKDYGEGRGLFDLDLLVHQGEVFGYLGPNGAGKSTTIRLLMDMIRPTRGSARILGMDVHDDSVEVKKVVGYLPGDLPDFGRMRASEVVGYMAGLRKVDVTDRVKELCTRLDLDLSRRFKEMSRGNRQKVGLVLAFMHDPQLLILDEPTGGLDPLMQQEFYALVRDAKARGATVFLSSHVLSEVQHICERVGVVREGRLVSTLEMAGVEDLEETFLELYRGSEPPAR